MGAGSPGHFAPMLPTATRATTLQVGIRAREWEIPAKSPSHAGAQWHRDLTQLTYRCGGSAGLDP
jgi:hypothetical protein